KEFDAILNRSPWNKIKLILEPDVAAQVYQRQQCHLVRVSFDLQKLDTDQSVKPRLPKEIRSYILSFLSHPSHLGIKEMIVDDVKQEVMAIESKVDKINQDVVKNNEILTTYNAAKKQMETAIEGISHSDKNTKN